MDWSKLLYHLLGYGAAVSARKLKETTSGGTPQENKAAGFGAMSCLGLILLIVLIAILLPYILPIAATIGLIWVFAKIILLFL